MNMKSHWIIVLLLGVTWMTGCSKKGEECPALLAISDAYGKTFSEIQTDGYTLKEIATIRQATMSVQQKVKKLNELKLTDEQLTALKASNLELAKQAAAMLTEMTDAFAAASDAELKKGKAAKGLDEAKAGLNAACEKKERKKKLRRKKKKECKKIDAEMANLPDGELTAEKMQAVGDALGKLTVSVPEVKAAIDEILGNFKAQTEAAEAIADARKKADAFKARLEDQKKKNADSATKLKTYCAAD
jgi:myosin heavy subunit